MRACKYAPTTSAVATSRRSAASAMSVIISASVAMVGEAVSSLVYSDRCGRPSAHDLPFNSPERFSLMRLMARSAAAFSGRVRECACTGSKTSLSSSWANSLNNASTAACPCFRIPTLADIWLKRYPNMAPALGTGGPANCTSSMLLLPSVCC